MHYFAYGSNMSLSRFKKRVPSAKFLGCHRLTKHDLRFHKTSKDGSGKCDAYLTSDPHDVVYGALFEIDPIEKTALDKAEGLGFGYDQKQVVVTSNDDSLIEAVTYIASTIDDTLKPYSWYMNHVLVGAHEISLPVNYIQTKISSIETTEDCNRERDARERSIHDPKKFTIK